MTKFIAHIQFNNGVSIKLPVEIETKHYSVGDARLTIERIAEKLGGELMYLERKE